LRVILGGTADVKFNHFELSVVELPKGAPAMDGNWKLILNDELLDISSIDIAGSVS
jgi:hypothetical protein